MLVDDWYKRKQRFWERVAFGFAVLSLLIYGSRIFGLVGPVVPVALLVTVPTCIGALIIWFGYFREYPRPKLVIILTGVAIIVLVCGGLIFEMYLRIEELAATFTKLPS